MLSPFRMYKIYHSVFLHFNTPKYDLFKYNKKINTSEDTFNNRPDRFRFDHWAMKLQSAERALPFCVFNFLHGKQWLYGAFDDAEKCVNQHLKFYASYNKTIKEEYDKIQQIKDEKGHELDELLKETKNGHRPPILQLYLFGRISIEFLCILNSDHNFIDRWSDIYVNDPFISDELNKVKKYSPFVKKFSNH